MKFRSVWFSAMLALGTLGKTHSQDPLADIPPPIVHVEKSAVRMHCWKQGIAFSPSSQPNQFYRASFEQTQPVKVPFEGVDHVVDVRTEGSKTEVIGRHHGNPVIRIRSQPDEPWTDLMVPVSLRLGDRTVLIPSTHAVAVLAGSEVWWYADDSWFHRELPPAPKADDGNFSLLPGETVQFLDEEIFYAGQNLGEWGGSLYRADLEAEQVTWSREDGGDAEHPERIPKRHPVCSIVKAKDGLWVLGAYSHLGQYEVGLYSKTSASAPWTILLNGSWEKERARIKFEVPDVFNDVVVHDSLYLLAIGFGIYRIAPDRKRLETVISTFDVNVQKYPIHLCVHPCGDLYVNTDGAGILAYRKREGQWTVKQILPYPPRP